MIGDIILIKDIHKRKAKRILSNNKIKDKTVLAIQGPSGVGKTEVATKLVELLFYRKPGWTSLLISIDDYYRTHWLDRTIVREEKGLDYVGIDEINWTALQHVIEDFKSKNTIRFQRINKYANKFEYCTMNSLAINTLVVEGLYAGYLRKFGLVDYVVHLDATSNQTYDFRMERKKENPESNFRHKIVEKETRVVGQLKQYADEIIPFELEG